jgi:toxin ParE1/3/4
LIKSPRLQVKISVARNVVWAPEARRDFKNQIGYIAQDSAENARRVAQRIKSAIALLAEHPIGRAGRVPNTYEKSVLHSSLIIAYSLEGRETLAILRIIHTARDWSEGKFPEA